MTDEATGQGQGQTTTRKPRADKGAKRGSRCGAFILQKQVRVEHPDIEPIDAWDDVISAATEAKAWKLATDPGVYRVVRQHGKQRTAQTQTVVKWG
jgi:hypothetical protein